MSDYLHGFSKKEQDRLIHQAEFLRPYVYQGVDFSQVQHLLEVGCGVGAQTEILLRSFPHLRITAVDLSEKQLAVAQQRLKTEVDSGRVEFLLGDASRISDLTQQQFDAAFLCWFLEHVPDPLLVLKNLTKTLKPGAEVVITEVNNSSLFLNPYSQSVSKYWYEFNDLQWSIRGHPFVGLQLGNLLHEAGFKDIRLETRPMHFDSRDSLARGKFLDYFFDIFASADDKLQAQGRIESSLLASVRADFDNAKSSRDGVFYYAFVRGLARR